MYWISFLSTLLVIVLNTASASEDIPIFFSGTDQAEKTIEGIYECGLKRVDSKRDQDPKVDRFYLEGTTWFKKELYESIGIEVLAVVADPKLPDEFLVQLRQKDSKEVAFARRPLRYMKRIYGGLSVGLSNTKTNRSYELTCIRR